MKKVLFLAAAGLISLSSLAQPAQQEENNFQFTVVKQNPITSIKNQASAGTCWSYSAIAFLESELIKAGKGTYDFSEMYIVENTYYDRAQAAVRTHGDVSFSQGGSF